jgi:hypothetical protein
MPLVCFSTETYHGELVDCSPSARRHATLTYETDNLCKMEALKPVELRMAYGLLKRD